MTASIVPPVDMDEMSRFRGRILGFPAILGDMSPTTDPNADSARGSSTSPRIPTPAPSPRTDLTDADWDVWREYFRSSRELNAALDRRLQDDAGISHPEYLVLLSLWRSPEHQLRTGELAQDLSWEKSRVSHQVTRMTKRGLVERRECADDARGVWVVLSKQGETILSRASLDHSSAIGELFLDVLSADERVLFLEASRRIRQRLRDTGSVVDEFPRTFKHTTLLNDTALPPEAEATAGDAS